MDENVKLLLICGQYLPQWSICILALFDTMQCNEMYYILGVQSRFDPNSSQIRKKQIGKQIVRQTDRQEKAYRAKERQ